MRLRNRRRAGAIRVLIGAFSILALLSGGCGSSETAVVSKDVVRPKRGPQVTPPSSTPEAPR